MGNAPDPIIPRMSPQQQATPPACRRSSAEFEADTVGLVLKHGDTAAAAANAIGVSHTPVCQWVREAKAAAGLTDPPGEGAADDPVDPTAENKRLRRELEKARMEVEIRKKATAFLAKEQL